ncbi:hypothetical protein [uncultured Microbacterium sp.]|uniref:hypothetical protein n=1 Tax=uncultured Microbacterium sp. TaxID=191216 RepID=UPI0025856462|nr:hypothetical protein [uncultured Microbacterium sp.]
MTPLDDVAPPADPEIISVLAANRKAVVRIEADTVRPGSNAINEISANSVIDASIKK